MRLATLDVRVVYHARRRTREHRALLCWDVFAMLILGRGTEHALVHVDGLNAVATEDPLDAGKPPRPRPYGLLM